MGNNCCSNEDFKDISIDFIDIQCIQCKKDLTCKGKNLPPVYGCQNETHLYCGECYSNFFKTVAICRCKICGRSMTDESKKTNQAKNVLIRSVDGFMPDKKIETHIKVSLLMGSEIKQYASTFEGVKKLVLVQSNLSKIDCLSYFSNVAFLHISNSKCANKIASINSVPNRANLQFLGVESNLLIQIPTVRCETLKNLVLKGNNIATINGLQNYPNLIVLNLSSNQLTAVTGLNTCYKLTSLMLNNNKITNLQGMFQLPSLLTQFQLQNNLVRKFDSYNCLATSLSLLLVGNPLTSSSLQTLHDCAFIEDLIKFSISIDDKTLLILQSMIGSQMTCLKQLLLNRDKNHIPGSLRSVIQKRQAQNKSLVVMYQKWKAVQN